MTVNVVLYVCLKVKMTGLNWLIIKTKGEEGEYREEALSLGLSHLLPHSERQRRRQKDSSDAGEERLFRIRPLAMTTS